jgi:hypothetical protein
MRFGKRITLVLAAAAALALGFEGAATADSGSAFGVQVSVLGGTIALGPTPLVITPPGGQRGLINQSASGVNVLGLSVSSQGSNGNVSSSAGIVGASTPGFITATGITSACNSTPTSATGNSQFYGASSPQTGPLSQSPPPNTSVPVPIGTLTLNEQQTTSNTIRVRAAHASAAPVADVILAESDCGVVLVGAATATAASPTPAGMPTLAG